MRRANPNFEKKISKYVSNLGRQREIDSYLFKIILVVSAKSTVYRSRKTVETEFKTEAMLYAFKHITQFFNKIVWYDSPKISRKCHFITYNIFR